MVPSGPAQNWNAPPDIVLIGPIAVGKSTVARLIAQAVCCSHVSLDEIAERYYAEFGFGRAEFERVRGSFGFLAAYRQWWPALAHAVEKVLAEHPDGVIDLGAGHTHYEDEGLILTVQRALRDRRNVVLLLPCSDPARSIQILRDRAEVLRGWSWSIDGYDFIERWVKDPGNEELATLTIYTQGKSPEETAREILRRIY